jgi:hypothetical protein
MIIFLGAAWSNGVRWFALRQQLKMMKNFDESAIDLNKIINNLKKEVEEKRKWE